eukprot:12689635-Ditylum_brightwellii.AAC.1
MLYKEPALILDILLCNSEVIWQLPTNLSLMIFTNAWPSYIIIHTGPSYIPENLFATYNPNWNFIMEMAKQKFSSNTNPSSPCTQMQT